MEDRYIDPENLNEILEKIKYAPTLAELKPICDSIFPNWIIGSMKEYSSDYPQLQKNWEKICSLLKVKPVEILIVDFLSFDPDSRYKLLRIFTEILTKTGFCVRKSGDFIPCNSCGLALPTNNLYNIMKANNVSNIPLEWSPNCEKCKI